MCRFPPIADARGRGIIGRMSQSKSFDEQVRATFEKVEASPAFIGDQLWLTFYISGPPDLSLAAF